MADIAFSDKAGSSNFTAGGDKRNEIFSDLLLNRAELETYLTSLRRQQYSASPPANPNTGDLWRCSTTGATYTAGVLYRYSGTAWVQEIATALNVPNRNTVLQGSVSASGVPTLFEAGTGLACKLNATATPAIFAFMNGNSASTGAQDIIDGIAADSAAFWSSLPINSTVYLFVDRSSTGVLSGSYTTVAPVTQNFAPAHSAGLQWVDFNTGKVQSSDGSVWTQRNRVYVGTATTSGSGVTAVNVCAYNQLFNDVTGNVTGNVVSQGQNLSPFVGYKNKLINGNFSINQRAVTGTVTLAAGAYGHDRWKAGASGCTYTFATPENVTTITITAGSLLQIIEGLNLYTGTHILSWQGTAQGKIGAGSYGASGITGAVTGGTNLNIEFGTGTLKLVQFEQGSVATPFESRHIGQEMALCQRYFCKSYSSNTSPGTSTLEGRLQFQLNGSSVDALVLSMRFPQTMRISPSMVGYTETGTAHLFNWNATTVTETFGSIGTGGCSLTFAGGGSSFTSTARCHWTANAEI